MGMMNTAEEKERMADYYVESGRKMYQVAHDILHHKENAEDAVMDTLLLFIDRFQVKEAYAQWDRKQIHYLMLKMTSLRALSGQRKEKRRNKIAPMVEYDGIAESIADEFSFETDDLRVSLLMTEIHKLDYEEQKVVYSCSSRWVSRPALAKELEISESGLKKRYQKLKKTLKINVEEAMSNG